MRRFYQQTQGGIISIPVDAVYVHFLRSEAEKLETKLRTLRYCDLNSVTSPLPRSRVNVKFDQHPSQELVYKCNQSEPRYLGGSLTVAPQTYPPHMSRWSGLHRWTPTQVLSLFQTESLCM